MPASVASTSFNLCSGASPFIPQNKNCHPKRSEGSPSSCRSTDARGSYIRAICCGCHSEGIRRGYPKHSTSDASAHPRLPSVSPTRPLQPHLVRGLKSQLLIQPPTLIARVQNHRLHSFSRAPFHRRLHQLPRQPLPSVRRLRINIHDIRAPLSSSNHVRRPIHQPQPRSRRHCSIRRDGKPRQILPRLHLPLHPWLKLLAHRLQRPLVAMSHSKKHRPPLVNDRLNIPFLQPRFPYREIQITHPLLSCRSRPSESASERSFFGRARLQPCRNPRKPNEALAAEGRFSWSSLRLFMSVPFDQRPLRSSPKFKT